MWRSVAVGLVVVLGACRGPREYVGPAPAGALECALREARDLGYSRAEGAGAEDFARVSQRVDRPAEVRPERGEPLPSADIVRPRPGDEPMYNELILREERGRLRIQIVPLPPGAEALEAGRTADGDAQRILAACTTG